ncbi:hypothetical protein EVAR_66535_1 [Eumeta japonica]|uniref:Uncharacterized protein n=1 Tax=Eumeta variegata TaxID=151549 RepID=A0A4C1ZAP0_EUMVA|nr:hypothetical protein EVAR_66535_1 [Eumeta japonica]
MRRSAGGGGRGNIGDGKNTRPARRSLGPMSLTLADRRGSPLGLSDVGTRSRCRKGVLLICENESAKGTVDEKFPLKSSRRAALGDTDTNRVDRLLNVKRPAGSMRRGVGQKLDFRLDHQIVAKMKVEPFIARVQSFNYKKRTWIPVLASHFF